MILDFLVSVVVVPIIQSLLHCCEVTEVNKNNVRRGKRVSVLLLIEPFTIMSRVETEYVVCCLLLF